MREQSQLRVPVESCIVTRSDIRGCKKFGKPTRLDENGGNYEDFAFNFEAHDAQQGAELARGQLDDSPHVALRQSIVEGNSWRLRKATEVRQEGHVWT